MKGNKMTFKKYIHMIRKYLKNKNKTLQKCDEIEYRYKNIYLEENIEKIFYRLNSKNTKYNPLTFSLIYKPYEYIQVFI